MKYNKLVRDKIPEHIRKRGGVPVAHVATNEEYWEKLKEKLIEEFAEFKRDESREEFADMLEVVDAIADYKGFRREDIAVIREAKAVERGRFKERIILEES